MRQRRRDLLKYEFLRSLLADILGFIPTLRAVHSLLFTCRLKGQRVIREIRISCHRDSNGLPSANGPSCG